MAYEYKALMAQAADSVLAQDPHFIPTEPPLATMHTIRRRKALSHIKYGPDKPLPPLPPRLATAGAPLRRKDFDQICLDLIKMPEMRRMLHHPISSPTEPSQTIPFPRSHIHRSLCITDFSLNGNPIYLRSRHFSLGPRGLRVGACEFLNLVFDTDTEANVVEHRTDGMLCLSSRPGIDGHPSFVLEYAEQLISQGTGKTTYMLASQTDITVVIWELANKWMHARTGTVLTPSRPVLREHANITKKDSGVSMGAGSSKECVDESPEGEPFSPVDWLSPSILNEASPGESKPVPQQPALPPNITSRFARLVTHIRAQHREHFVLVSTCKGSGQWQIAYTSSCLHVRKEDMRAALGLTDAVKLEELRTKLAGKGEVEMVVRWGVKGKERRLRCVPMVRSVDGGRREALWWLCFLL